MLSGSSAVAIAAGVLEAKACALLLGPSGLGLMSLLQSLLGLATMIAGLGVGAAIVRDGAAALAAQDEARFSALRRGAWLLLWLSLALTLSVMTALRVPISRWGMGGPQHALSVALMGLAVGFYLAQALETSILNACHRVGALARVGVLKSVLATALLVGIVWLWREDGIAPALIASTACGWAVAHYFSRREVAAAPVVPGRRVTLEAASALLRFGMPFTASMLVGAGAQLVLPVLVLHRLGIKGVGFYGAAATISLGYVGVLLNSMAQDYYPRIIAASREPSVLGGLINQQHRIVMLLAIPMILGLMALARYVVGLVYSPAFYPGVELLEWQLVADLLRFSAWTMTFVVLARSGSGMYFLTESIGGVTLITTSWFGVRWFGLAGLGLASLVTAVVYYFMVSLIVKRDIGLVWTRSNKIMIGAALSAALLIRLLRVAGLDGIGTTVALALAAIASLGSFYLLRNELRAPTKVKTTFGTSM
jgi:antigen flippase